MNEAEKLPELPAAPKKKKGGIAKTLILSVVVLGIAGGAAGWWFLRGTKAQAEEAPPPLESRGVVTFEPFLVNLADAGGNRFLKVSMQLVVGTPEEAKHVQESPVVVMHLRSEILELLTMQQAAVLVTAEGKKTLKDAIKTRVSPDLPHLKVLDVLFSEFVVQF
jgi:flagellar FliL protein